MSDHNKQKVGCGCNKSNKRISSYKRVSSYEPVKSRKKCGCNNHKKCKCNKSKDDIRIIIECETGLQNEKKNCTISYQKYTLSPVVKSGVTCELEQREGGYTQICSLRN